MGNSDRPQATASGVSEKSSNFVRNSAKFRSTGALRSARDCVRHEAACYTRDEDDPAVQSGAPLSCPHLDGAADRCSFARARG